MTTNNQLPIAEVFSSIQGEGFWVGTPMRFIRLAGCPVGAKATQEQVSTAAITKVTIPILNNGLRGSWCKTYDGRPFICDTDFSVHTYKTVDELIGETTEKHICLTGGEPLIHQERLIELGFFQQAFAKNIHIHVETSGTIPLRPTLAGDVRLWVTVAPKHGCLVDVISQADEIKLLVDEHFDVEKIPWDLIYHKVFLSPINGEKEVNQDNVKRCLEILKDHPDWRLSAQWHKFLNLQ